MTNRRVDAAPYISQQTVKNYVKKIMQKLHLKTAWSWPCMPGASRRGGPDEPGQARAQDSPDGVWRIFYVRPKLRAAVVLSES